MVFFSRNHRQMQEKASNLHDASTQERLKDKDLEDQRTQAKMGHSHLR